MDTDFATLRLSPALLQVVRELGYEKLTPIQARSIPVLLEGRDLVGQSKTGSGKTAAFTLPILNNLSQNKEIQGLILCPTRELCAQVAREVRKLGRRNPGLQVLVLSGGQSMHEQLQALKKGVQLVVGTPGRVLDHLKRGTLDLKRVATVVLDEADRMLDMGFQDDMEAILGALPSKRQTVFFSATFPRSIEEMSRAYQHDPVAVTIDEAGQAGLEIEQQYYEAEQDEKFKVLRWLLQKHKPESAIVFCNFKATVADLAHELAGAGLSTAALHGDLEQSDRDRVMAKFRNHSVRVLIATDVAARGIDVESLDMVFNFELPAKPEIYVHRIGRTGRAGKSGLAISLATARERVKVQEIEAFTGARIEHRSLPAARRLEAETAAQDSPQNAAMDTLFISGGRKDKMRPGDILGALTGEAGGLNAADIGKIEIHDRFSYVAVSKNISRIALERLSGGRIKGRRFRIERVR